MIERDDGSRVLELNEGQAQHSIYDPDTTLTGDYWDGHAGAALHRARRGRPRRIAILGNAAGTTSRAYEEFFPRTVVDGVEIDGELSEIGRRYFDMNNPRLHLHHEDARPWLRRTDDRFDVIFVDAYRQPYIPFYLATKEFFELVRDRLTPGGVVVMNVGHPGGRRRAGEGDRGHDGRGVPERAARSDGGHEHAGGGQPATPLSAEQPAARACRACRSACAPPRRAAAGRIRPPLRGGGVYTDDRAPVEWLIDRSIVDYAAGE